MYNIEVLEKMVKEACEKNDYELYKEACCLLHLYAKICSESEDKRVYSVLFDSLSNEKSQYFLNIVREIVKNKDSSNADTILYGLLLSVRIHDEPVIASLLTICDEIQAGVLNSLLEEEKSEKREQR